MTCPLTWKLAASENTLFSTNFSSNSTEWFNQNDFLSRLKFCNYVLHSVEFDENFVENSVFSDEANFHVNGHVNHHNSFYYGKENLIVITPKMVNSPSIVIWVACNYQGVCSCRLYDRTVYKEFYLNILE